MTEPRLPEMDSPLNLPLEPARLLENSSEGFERRLLAAAGTEHMPAAARERMARALGVPQPPPVAARPLAKSARIGRGGSLVGWGAAAAVSLALAAHALHTRRSAELLPTRSSAQEAPLLPAPSPASYLDAPAAVAEHTPTAPAAEEAAHPTTEPFVRSSGAKTEPRPRSGVPAQAVHPGSVAPVVAPSNTSSPRSLRPELAAPHSLRPELAALDRIQSALRARQAAAAAAALDAYRQQFPRGELALEAELLGVDIALARGREADAQVLARGILARPEGEHYRQRLETLLGRNQAENAGSAQRTAPASTSRSGGDSK